MNDHTELPENMNGYVLGPDPEDEAYVLIAAEDGRRYRVPVEHIQEVPEPSPFEN